MEIRLRSEHLTFPKNFSLQQMVKHSIAEKFWGEFALKATIDEEPDFFRRKLAPHNEAVLNNVLRVFSTYLPENLMNEVLHAVIDLHEGYRRAHCWEREHKRSLPFTILNPLTSDSYAAGYFITPGGHFDDFSWVQKFVSDESQCVQKRFQLACFYCFEGQILHLWHTMKTNGQLLCNGNLKQIKKLGDLVLLWVCQIEDKMHEFELEPSHILYIHNDDRNFNISGFNAATWSCHKDAARFFWTRCSDIEKRYILQNIDSFLLFLAQAAYMNDAEFIYFILSFIFPVEKKNSLIEDSMRLNKAESVMGSNVPLIWCCLLRSQFWEPALKDILTFPISNHPVVYFKIVFELFTDLYSFGFPFHKSIVKVLWSKFCQLQEEVVCSTLLLVEYLERQNAVDLIEILIEPLRDSEKEIIFKKYPHKAIAHIVDFSYVHNYDAVLRYLLVYLIDCSEINRTLRVNAPRFLDYVDKQILKRRIDELSQREKNEVNEVIDCVQGSVQVLDHLLEKVENDGGRKCTSC